MRLFKIFHTPNITILLFEIRIKLEKCLIGAANCDYKNVNASLAHRTWILKTNLYYF